MNVSHRAYHAARAFVVGALAVFVGISTPALADAPALAPQTKIRLKIVQWMPTKGNYEQWGALSGEFIVSEAGAVSLPVIGTVFVGNLDNARLAAEIAKRLQAKIGLVEVPEATIEILEYPPIYVVGDVTKPGEYKFRPGLTVLQSLAMSGGEARLTNQQQHSRDEIGLVGELQEIDRSLLRTGAKIARLQAEMSGAKEIRFVQPIGADGTVAAAIYNQETIIFSARANVLDRQSKSFSELRDLFTEEIKVLEVRVQGADASIKATEQQLNGVKSLVERGVAVSSRQSDLERALAGYRADRLDLVTAIMRVRQNISEATRNLEGLYDKHQSDVAAELQSEQAVLDQLKLKRATKEKLLLDTLSVGGGSAPTGQEASFTFTVTRRDNGKASEVPASETTVLMPGDVIRVVRRPPPAALDSSSSGEPQSNQASQ